MSDVLARDYPAHLTAVRRHFDAAMQAAGCDQVAVYAGFPSAWNALGTMKQSLDGFSETNADGGEDS